MKKHTKDNLLLSLYAAIIVFLFPAVFSKIGFSKPDGVPSIDPISWQEWLPQGVLYFIIALVFFIVHFVVNHYRKKNNQNNL